MSLVASVLRWPFSQGVIDYLRQIRWQFSNFRVLSYAQSGEDLILSGLKKSQRKGFYVDVGAHHPKRISNTYLFYRRGWRGINIDPLPGSMALFNRVRPRDINLEIAISQIPGQLTYYMFNDGAFNSFDPSVIERYRTDSRLRWRGQTTVQTYRLEDVLTKYLPEGTAIDFLSVDAEGLDLEVLSSNNWGRFHPHYILVENQSRQVDLCAPSEIKSYLMEQGYSLIAHTLHTAIYVDRRM
jgi:FkbM family methyltransferase